MPTVRTFLGGKNGSRLVELGTGNVDVAGDATYEAEITPRLETPAIYPAGLGGEAIFHVLWLTLTHTMAVDVKVEPIVDGELHSSDWPNDSLLPHTISLSAEASRKTKTFEIGLSRPHERSGVEVGRVGLRGERFAVRITIPNGLGTGDLILEGLSLEREVVLEGQEADNAS